jgi:hypothetical protein
MLLVTLPPWLSGAASSGDGVAALLPCLWRFAGSGGLGESGELRRPNMPPVVPLTPAAGMLPLPTLRSKESGSVLEAVPQVCDAAYLRERLRQCIYKQSQWFPPAGRWRRRAGTDGCVSCDACGRCIAMLQTFHAGRLQTVWCSHISMLLETCECWCALMVANLPEDDLGRRSKPRVRCTIWSTEHSVINGSTRCWSCNAAHQHAKLRLPPADRRGMQSAAFACSARRLRGIMTRH